MIDCFGGFMSIFTSTYFSSHEHIGFFYDAETGLRAIIALHSSVLGPASGGTRFLHYKNEQDAIDDALRLSKGMTYKNALAGNKWGGAKGVILAEEGMKPTHEILGAYMRAVNTYNGRFKTGEDVGINNENAAYMMTFGPHFVGLSKDPTIDFSHETSKGVLYAIKAALKVYKGNSELKGVRIAVQGLGKVGYYLAKLLVEHKATVYACDADQERTKEAHETLGLEIVSPEDIYGLDVDIFSPCALGAIINERTLPLIRAPIIAGSANNQLLNAEIGKQVFDRGILYVPDYVANAGGVISAQENTHDVLSKERLAKSISLIYDRSFEILKRSIDKKVPTDLVADMLAQEILSKH